MDNVLGVPWLVAMVVLCVGCCYNFLLGLLCPPQSPRYGCLENAGITYSVLMYTCTCTCTEHVHACMYGSQLHVIFFSLERRSCSCIALPCL